MDPASSERRVEAGAPMLPEHIPHQRLDLAASWGLQVRAARQISGRGRGRGRGRLIGSSHSREQLEESVVKRQRTSGPEMQTTMMDSAAAVLKFKVDYEQTKHLRIGEAVHSDAISAGGHTWRINCFQRWNPPGSASIFVELMSKSRSVKAAIEVVLMDNGGEPSSNAAKCLSGVHLFQMDDDTFGWLLFKTQTDLEMECMKEGQITFMCCIMVLEDSSIPVPPSDICKNLGTLLDSADGADVSFTVDGETFHAHRAVLAARSEVFRAELFGSMAEATMPSITLHDIAPETFKAMLRFMYTDALPGNDELGDSPTRTMFEHLLAAADRYALDRLKLLCAQKLWDCVSVDTVADALACAEIYNCPELKNKCIDFVVAERNFKKAVLTDGFMQLGQKFPSIVAEVRKRVGT